MSTNNCGCTTTTTNICSEPVKCSCPTLLSSSCVNNVDVDLECSNILKGQTLSEVLVLLDEFICTKFDSVTNFFQLINVGTGSEVYKGVSMLGKKEMRTLLDSGLINLVQGTNDITISVDEVALNTFIEANQKTYSVANIGTGANVYKDSTISGDNTQFNVRKINTSNSGTGAIVLKPQVENTNDISIIAKTLLLESQGNGASIIKDLQSNTDDNKIRLKSLVSSSLNITETTDEISIEVPVVTDIPALIVNSAYTGEEETGTASKPFKTIQAALDAYKGTGGKGTIADPTSPEMLGSTIEVQKGIGAYNFTGDFDYKNLHISLKEGAVINSTPSGTWLMDFNSFSTTTVHLPIISFEEGAFLICNKNGFKLVGGDFALGTNNRKILKVNSNSKGTNIVLAGALEADILFEIDGSNLQYVNGGYGHLEVTAGISTNRGRMFVIKGNGVVNCDSNLIYFLNDAATAVITNTYPPIEIKNNGILKLSKSNVVFPKTPTVTYNQFIAIYDSAVFESIDSVFAGETVYFAYNGSALNTPIIKLDSCKMYMQTTASFAGNISGVWGNMFLNNNNMSSTSINPLTTSIAPASLNTIGGKVIETLNSFTSKSAAVLAGLPVGAKFINKNDISAGSFVVGLEYKILTVGTTDFTLIGASANTVGLYFTATGAGTGSGTASLIRVDIVI